MHWFKKLTKIEENRIKKSWVQDRQYCMTIFNLARLIMSYCLLLDINEFNLDLFLDSYKTKNDDSTLNIVQPLDSEKQKRRIPFRMVIAFFVMFIVTLWSSVSCSLIDQKFPIWTKVSLLTDFIIIVSDIYYLFFYIYNRTLIFGQMH